MNARSLRCYALLVFIVLVAAIPSIDAITYTGQQCTQDTDCAAGICDLSVNQCASFEGDTCGNGIHDPASETDIDCGMACAPCSDNKACVADTDCMSGCCSNATHLCDATQCEHPVIEQPLAEPIQEPIPPQDAPPPQQPVSGEPAIQPSPLSDSAESLGSDSATQHGGNTSASDKAGVLGIGRTEIILGSALLALVAILGVLAFPRNPPEISSDNVDLLSTPHPPGLPPAPSLQPVAHMMPRYRGKQYQESADAHAALFESFDDSTNPVPSQAPAQRQATRLWPIRGSEHRASGLATPPGSVGSPMSAPAPRQEERPKPLREAYLHEQANFGAENAAAIQPANSTEHPVEQDPSAHAVLDQVIVRMTELVKKDSRQQPASSHNPENGGDSIIQQIIERSGTDNAGRAAILKQLVARGAITQSQAGDLADRLGIPATLIS